MDFPLKQDNKLTIRTEGNMYMFWVLLKLYSSLCIHFRAVFKILHLQAYFKFFQKLFFAINIRLIHFILLLHLHILYLNYFLILNLCFPPKFMPQSTISVAAAYHIILHWHITAIKGKPLQMHGNLMMQWMFYRLLNVFCSGFHTKLYKWRK